MKKVTSRALSVILALVMVVSSLPFVSLTAFADEEKDHYLFAYFTGDDTYSQKIKFSVSEDGTAYKALNGNEAIITPTLGSKCVRDPYIFIGQDGYYYCVATDLDSQTMGWWGNSQCAIFMWRSSDLITWTNETRINVAEIIGIADDQVYRAWAPQVIWDDNYNDGEGAYMVYFAIAANGYSAGGTKMHYMYTTDLLDQSKYTSPQPMMKNNDVEKRDSIDADITYYNGTYYMFYKDESEGGICIVKSDTINGPYDTDNIIKLNAGDSIGALEGCQVWWNSNLNQYVFMADRYYAKGVFACYNIGDNLDTFYNAVSSNSDISGYYNSAMSSNISGPSPRHGAVIPITKSEYDALVDAYGISNDSDITYGFDRNYSAENSWHYDAIQDSSGYTYDLMTNNGQYTYSYSKNHYIALNGSAMFINDSRVRTMFTGSAWTATFNASVAESRGSTLFALTSGDSAAASIDWIRLLDNGKFYLYKNGAYTEIGSTTLNTTVEYSFAVVYNGSYIYLYKDGELVCSDNIGTISYDNTKYTSYIAFGWTDTIGVSGINGAISNVRFRDRALSAADIAGENSINASINYRYNEGTETVDGRINTTYNGGGWSADYTPDLGSSYTIASWVNIGAQKHDNAVLFEFGTGGEGDGKQYFNLLENGAIFYCWNEGSTSHYVDISSIYNFNLNTWYYFQVNIVPSGNSVHIRAWVNAVQAVDVTSGYNNMTSYDFNPINLLSSTVTLKFGKGNAHWGNAGYNLIDDFRVYSRAVDPSVLYSKQQATDRAEAAGDSGTSTGSTLDEAMGIFEYRVSQMAESGYSKLYTNISPAYEAYKDAVAVKAAGGAENTALTNLNVALADMTLFVPYTATSIPSGTNYNPESYFFNNVIYSEPVYEDGHRFDENVSTVLYDSYGAFWKYGVHAYAYIPNIVLMYDGVNTPTVPVMYGFLNSDGRYSLTMLYLAENMDDFMLNTPYWQGYTDSQTFIWPSVEGNQIIIDKENPDSDGMSTWNGNGSESKSTYRIVKNGLSYTAIPKTSYTCYSSTNWEMQGQYNYLGGDHQINGALVDSEPDIVIIDYSRLTTALSTAANNATYKGYLSDMVEKYTTGGLEGIFAAYDSATSLDPNTGSSYFNHTYDYANKAGADIEEPMDAAALLCADDIDNSVILLNNIRITSDDARFQRLRNAIKSYEDTMKSMTSVHTNLEAAYKAYLIAIEYKDAYEYGNRTAFENPSLVDAAKNLEDAIYNMKSWSSRTWDGIGKVGGNKASGGYNNVLYCSNQTNWNGSNKYDSSYGNESSGIRYRIGLPDQVVLLYDGTSDVYYPAAYEQMTGSASNRRTYSVYLNGTLNDGNNTACEFGLKSAWKGYLSGGTGESSWIYSDVAADYEDSNFYKVGWESSVKYNAANGYESDEVRNTGTYRVYYNKLYFTGSFAEDEYYKKQYRTVFQVNSKNKSSGTEGTMIYSNNTSYVVNYTPLKNKIESITFPSGIDVTQYQEGNLSTWLSQWDTLTSIDPNQYDAINHPNGYNYSEGESYSGLSGTEGAVYHCASDISGVLIQTASMDKVISNIPTDTKTNGSIYKDDVLQPISPSNGAYTNLKIAIEEAKSAPTSQGCIISSYWDDYNTALKNATDAMLDIANANNSNYTDKQGYASNSYDEDAINTLADNLDNSIKALSELSNSAHPLKFSYEKKGTHDGYFQCYSNNAHVLDAKTHTTLVYADMTAYDALNMVYNTIDRTKYSDLSVIDAGKSSFDAVKTTAGPAGVSADKIVDKGISDLLNSINSSNNDVESGEFNDTNTYDVTFNIYTIDGSGNVSDDTVVAPTVISDIPYGTVKSFDAKTADVLSALSSSGVTEENFKVQRWTVNGVQVSGGSTTDSVDVYLQSNSTVNAYVLLPITDADKTPVYINNISGKTLFSVPVTDESTVTYDKNNPNNIIIDGKTYSVPNSLTYVITGWTLFGGYYSVDESFTDKTIAELKSESGESASLTFRPVKVKNIAPEDKYTFVMDGETIAENVSYDYRLKVTTNFVDTDDETAYAIIFFNSDDGIYVPVVYLDDEVRSYTFYANRSMEFRTLTKKADGYYVKGNGENAVDIKITDEETLFYLDYKMPMVYSYSEVTGYGNSGGVEYPNKYTTRSAFTMNVGGTEAYGDVTITECGTLRTTDNLSVGSLVVENVGRDGFNITKTVNPNVIALSNQFSYTLSTKSDAYRTVHTRAYVKYSYTYNDTKIDAVAYGPVCACEYGIQ